MKKKFRIIVALSIAFLNFSLAFGQEKSIEKKDFESIIKKAKANLVGKTYRLTENRETFRDRNESPVESIKTIDEFVAPDKKHHFFEYKSSSYNEKIETINIGKKILKKVNDVKW